MSVEKNVVVILIDALSNKDISEHDSGKTPTEFLSKLKMNSVFCPRVFSEAPFTEGAMISTHAGENTFDNGGYLFGNKNCKMVMAEYYKNKGYHTIGTYAPYIFPSAMSRGFDELYYMNTVKLNIMKQFRLKEFKKKFDKEGLNDDDYGMMRTIVEDQLIVLIDYLTCVITGDSKIEILKDVLDKIDYEKMKTDIEMELERCSSNPREYVNQLFSEWENFRLFNYPLISLPNKVEDFVRKEVLSRHIKDLEWLRKVQLKIAKKNGRIKFKTLYSETMSQGVLATYKYLRGVKNYRSSTDFDEDFSHYDNKYCMSMRSVLSVFEEKLINLEKQGQKFFAYIHLDDFHFPSTFFSYDSDSVSHIDEEFININRYVEGIDDSYCGNLRTDLSLLYVDSQLKQFFERIKEKLYNTVFIIMADHGNSYCNNPIRATGIMDFQCEKFQTPLFIFGDCIKPKIIKGLFSTKDIFKTIAYYSGVFNEEHDGKIFDDCYVIGKDTYRDYIITEWGGPGIPDLRCKPIYQSIFDGKYNVGVKSMINKNIISRNVVSVYDLENDPNEENNIAYKLRNSDELRKYINILQKRKNDIKKHVSI